MEQTNNKRFKRIKRSFYVLIFIGILCLSCIYGNANISNKNEANKQNISVIQKSVPNIMQYDSVYYKDSIKSELISEVSKYINRQAPKSHQFIPKYLVQSGLDHNIDICFMMAQTQIETNFGTMGIGRESSKRSMFGVMSYKYDSYDKAINHYCEVLKKHYLVKGKTEQHLLTKYVTGKGGRYAANPRYEKELTLAYMSIKRSTKINSLQKEYSKL